MADEAGFPYGSQHGAQHEVPMPKPRARTWTVVLVWVQVVVGALAGWLMLYLGREEESHGREAGLLYLLGCANFVVAAVLAVCAVLLVGRRSSGPRYTVLVIEVLVILFWFVTLATAETGGGTGMPPVLPMIIMVQLCRKELAEWYDDSPSRR